MESGGKTMQKQNLAIICNIAVIILLIIACVMVGYVTHVIKSEGGKCTAKPEIYLEMKLKEQYGSDYDCICKKESEWAMEGGMQQWI